MPFYEIVDARDIHSRVMSSTFGTKADAKSAARRDGLVLDRKVGGVYQRKSGTVRVVTKRNPKRRNGKSKRLMASGSKKLAAWVRSQGKKNPRSPRNGYTVHPGNDNYAGLAAAKKAAKSEAKRSGSARVENQDTGKTVATYGGGRSNPRRASVKLPRTGHTGFLKASAVDVITRGGRVVEVKVKR